MSQIPVQGIGNPNVAGQHSVKFRNVADSFADLVILIQ